MNIYTQLHIRQVNNKDLLYNTGTSTQYSVITYMRKWKSGSEVSQSCPTLCDPMDCSPPSSSIHGILQARILEWIAISFSKGSSQPRDRTHVSRIVDRHFTVWANVADTVHPCFNGILPQSYFSLFFKHMPAELAFFNWTIFKVFIAFVTILLLICFGF